MILDSGPNSREEVVKYLKKLPKYTDAEQLKQALEPPRTKEEELLFWICQSYGSVFTLASDKLLIPGFAPDVQQFIVSNQLNLSRQDQFEEELEKTKGKSTVLFHGTSLDNLYSIMADGFKASTDITYGTGNFMGDSPRTAYIYAHHRACLIRDKATGNYATEKWNWRPSRDRAVMMGCQVAGSGRLVNDVSERTGKVHVIENLQSIAIRYVFLLPDYQYKNRDEDLKAPEKAKVEKPLLEAFKKFPTKKQLEEEERKLAAANRKLKETARKLEEAKRRLEEIKKEKEEKIMIDQEKRLAEEGKEIEKKRRKDQKEADKISEEEACISRELFAFPWILYPEEASSIRDQLHLPALTVICWREGT